MRVVFGPCPLVSRQACGHLGSGLSYSGGDVKRHLQCWMENTDGSYFHTAAVFGSCGGFVAGGNCRRHHSPQAASCSFQLDFSCLRFGAHSSNWYSVAPMGHQRCRFDDKCPVRGKCASGDNDSHFRGHKLLGRVRSLTTGGLCRPTRPERFQRPATSS